MHSYEKRQQAAIYSRLSPHNKAAIDQLLASEDSDEAHSEESAIISFSNLKTDPGKANLDSLLVAIGQTQVHRRDSADTRGVSGCSRQICRSISATLRDGIDPRTTEAPKRNPLQMVACFAGGVSSSSENNDNMPVRLSDFPSSKELWAMGKGSDSPDESTFGCLVLDELGASMNTRDWNDKAARKSSSSSCTPEN